MNAEDLEQLLERVQQRKLTIAQALQRLRDLPFEDLGYAKVDHHRALRQGFPEVVMGQGKLAKDIAGNVLITRLADGQIEQLKRYRLGLKIHSLARAATWSAKPIRATGKGTILVVSAGTSDITVAEEAAVTAAMMGNPVERLFDVGVAGIHRLLGNRGKLESAAVLIVVAGMEGALPSVVAGLVAKPVIAVPTSIGYGASFHGLSALLGMLNSCAAGVTVVNIDNGFGAGFAASLINRV